MSFNMDWDVNKYKEEHECENQWQLRKAFMIKWKNDYPEDRLVCLARVFINMEFMGCRYPTEVMHEVARLSADIAKNIRNSRKNKLKRTLVSASNAAADRTRSNQRKGSIAMGPPPAKSHKISFVPAGQESEMAYDKNDQMNNDLNNRKVDVNYLLDALEPYPNNKSHISNSVKPQADIKRVKNENNRLRFSRDYYLKEMSQIECVNVRQFNEDMFQTEYGRFILIIRPWNDMYNNILNSCISCKASMVQNYDNPIFSFIMNGRVLATAEHECRTTAKTAATKIAWKILAQNSITLMMKEQYIPQNKTLISMDDMSNKYDFGTPIEGSVALNMMKLMGWKGGGLGADSQGIAEPIKPNLRMVNRSGLGHGTGKSLQELRRAGLSLLRHRDSTLDADLVFTSEFTSEERSVLHQCAKQCGLYSKSYGPKGADRFLVISNKMQPFTLVRSVVQRGGETPKYRVFIPAALVKNSPH